MVVVARLDWVRSQVAANVSTRISISYNHTLKVCIHIYHGCFGCSPVSGDILTVVERWSSSCRCWDTGHRHSNNVSFVCFYIQHGGERASHSHGSGSTGDS
eukprot:TRINITY_DN43057_c0_g1_i2.p1 TRINITY_DN43057_c0_g1~~TRINITY_DN43057_c0_g1_i2.p1  ORF type:complete len:101 (-),score=5.58 TRINITY_DN43057_c0_g1_i2:59-361(-)